MINNGEERPLSIKLTNPGNVDWYYGGGLTAYASIEDALATVPGALRLGKTVGILIDGTVVEYWFKDGITDEDLVVKNSGFGGDVDLTDYYTKEESNSKFLTGYTIDLSDYYSKEDTDSIFQVKGNYLTGVTSYDITDALGYVPLSGYTADLSNYYTKSQSDSKYLTGITVDLSGYYTKVQSDAKYLTGFTVDFSNYYSKVQSDAKYLTTAFTVDLSGYQPVGNYLTGITKTQVTTALGYSPVSGSTTLAGYGVTSGDTLFDGRFLPLNTDLNAENQKVLNLLTSPNKVQSFGASVENMTTTMTVVTQQFKTLPLSPITSATTLYGVTFWQSVQGVYTPNNENSISLYAYSNGVLTKVATTGNLPNLWANSANTFANVFFTTPYVATPGTMYFLGLLFCAASTTTAPTIGCAPAILNAAAANANLPNNTKLFGTVLAQTAAPATINMSSVNGSTAKIWVGMF